MSISQNKDFSWLILGSETLDIVIWTKPVQLYSWQQNCMDPAKTQSLEQDWSGPLHWERRRLSFHSTKLACAVHPCFRRWSDKERARFGTETVNLATCWSYSRRGDQRMAMHFVSGCVGGSEGLQALVSDGSEQLLRQNRKQLSVAKTWHRQGRKDESLLQKGGKDKGNHGE